MVVVHVFVLYVHATQHTLILAAFLPSLALSLYVSLYVSISGTQTTKDIPSVPFFFVCGRIKIKIKKEKEKVENRYIHCICTYIYICIWHMHIQKRCVPC